LRQEKQKTKKGPLHEARFKLNVDYFSTFERLDSAGLNPKQTGGRPTLHGDSPGAQIRVEIDKPPVVALISHTKIQIYYEHNQDLPDSIWKLQPFIIETETQKPVDNLATKLEYTTLTKTEVEDMRKTLLANDLKMMLQLEKNRVLTDIFLSLVSDLKSIDDAKMQTRIKPILKKATDSFSNLET
jgi:hypothetical protein